MWNRNNKGKRTTGRRVQVEAANDEQDEAHTSHANDTFIRSLYSSRTILRERASSEYSDYVENRMDISAKNPLEWWKEKHSDFTPSG